MEFDWVLIAGTAQDSAIPFLFGLFLGMYMMKRHLEGKKANAISSLGRTIERLRLQIDLSDAEKKHLLEQLKKSDGVMDVFDLDVYNETRSVGPHIEERKDWKDFPPISCWDHYEDL